MFVINVHGGVSYRELWDCIFENCSEMRGQKLTIGYVINGGPFCMLQNDKDVSIMFKFQVMVGVDFIDVVVEREKPINENSSMNSDLSFSGNLAKGQLVRVRYINNRSAVMSDAWRSYISKVG